MRSTPLKIGLVLDDTLDNPDGVQQYVTGLGEWLRAQGHQVHYLVGATSRTDLANIHSLSRNRRVRFNGNSLSIPLPADRSVLRQLLATERFDVLHVQMPYSPWLAGRIISMAPPSTVVVATFHILPHSWFVRLCNRGLALYERRTLRRLNRVFAVSSAAQTFAARTFGLRSTVVPNVLDVPRFATAKPLPELHVPGITTILYMGRLVPRKGCQTLLKAVALLAKNGSRGFRVVMCGKGPLDAVLKTYATDHQLNDIVTFTGFVSEADKPRYYKSAHIAVFPSLAGESFGIVLAEAMAAGTLTIAARNPGYAAVLEDDPAALFPPGNATALAQKLATYMQDPAARIAIQTRQAARVAAFDTPVVGTTLQAAYDELIAANGPAVHNT